MALGDEIHAPSLRNPVGDPDYDRGYTYAQQLGHMVLNQARPEDIQRWKTQSSAWKMGFVSAAKNLGVGAIERELGEAKMAWAAEYLKTKTANFPYTVQPPEEKRRGPGLAPLALGAAAGAGAAYHYHDALKPMLSEAAMRAGDFMHDVGGTLGA